MHRLLHRLPELPAEGAELGLWPRRRREVDLPGGPAPLRWRESGQGMPVLLLPGAFTGCWAWCGVAVRLAKTARAILAETVPLVDASAPPADDVTLDGIANALQAMVAALGLERPLLVAQDVLGLAALRLSLAQPDRVGGLLLVGCAFAPLRRRWFERPFSGPAWRTRAARRISRRPLARALADFGDADPTAWSRLALREIAEALSTMPGALAFLRRRASLARPAFSAGLRADLDAGAGKPFPVPLKVLVGDGEPPAVRAAGEELARGFPGTEVFVAERCASAVFAEQPQWTARIIAEATAPSR